jgi:hypothetical protein
VDIHADAAELLAQRLRVDVVIVCDARVIQAGALVGIVD